MSPDPLARYIARLHTLLAESTWPIDRIEIARRHLGLVRVTIVMGGYSQTFEADPFDVLSADFAKTDLAKEHLDTVFQQLQSVAAESRPERVFTIGDVTIAIPDDMRTAEEIVFYLRSKNVNVRAPGNGVILLDQLSPWIVPPDYSVSILPSQTR